MSTEDLRGRPTEDPTKEPASTATRPYEVLEIAPPLHSKFFMDFGEHRIKEPDRREELRLVTTFPNQATMTFPYTEDEFVLIEEDTYVAGPKLEAPGGVKRLDDPQGEALRLVKRETGIEFDPDSVSGVVKYQTSALNTDNQTFLSSGQVASIGEQDPEITSTIRLRYIYFDEALDRVIDDSLPYGERINTGSVVLGILRTLDRVARERGLDFSSHVRPVSALDSQDIHTEAPFWKVTDSRVPDAKIPPHLPYSLVGREVIKERDDETQRVQLIHDTVAIGGETKDQYWVNQPDYVRVIPMDEHGSIYFPILPNYPYNINWPVMAGDGVRDEETYAETAQRVIRDIFGPSIDPDRLRKVFDFEEVTSRMRVREKVIAARVSEADVEGAQNLVRLSAQEAWKMVKVGQIQATTTAATVGLLKYRRPIFG